MRDYEIKFATVYTALKPRAEEFKRMAVEREVARPRTLVEAALAELAAKVMVDCGFNEATRAESTEVCAAVIARLTDELFPTACR